MVLSRNVVILEDYNGVLHAFYGNPGEPTVPESNIIHAYSTDMGNTWEGHTTLYEMTGNGWHVTLGSAFSQLVMAYATDGPTIYIAWREKNFATNYQRMMAGEVDISNLSAPSMTEIVVHQGESSSYTFNGPQIVSTSDGKIMMYYMQYQGTGWFVPKYKFAPSFSMLEDSSTPTRDFNSYLNNGHLTYIYNSSSPILLVDDQDNILYTISGRFSGINNLSPPDNLTDYNPGYGSLIARYNNSGNYTTGDNWDVVQHYGRDGMNNYWDNFTQAFCVDSIGNVHWVFEYQVNGWGSYGNDGGDYQFVYGTGLLSDPWSFDYTDPIHPDMTSSGAKYAAEFIYASIDTNSQGEIWITYQDAYQVDPNPAEIYYTHFDGSTWQDPIEMTVPPMDEGYYPYMFISSWDAMYVVFSDAKIDGDPWLKVINTL